MTDRGEDKDVVITGAGSGVGGAFVVSLAREGVSAGGMVLV